MRTRHNENFNCTWVLCDSASIVDRGYSQLPDLSKSAEKERAIFNSAIYEDFYEGRHFVRSLIIFGVLGSIILGGFLSISLPWLIVYEALMALFLLVIPWWLLPVTIAGISSVVTLLLPTLPQLAPIFKWFNQLGIRSASVNPINLLIIFVVVIGLTAVFIHLNGGKFDSPTLVRNQRNNKIAIYKFNELSIFRSCCLFLVTGFTPVFHLCRYFKSVITPMRCYWFPSYWD